jgi:UDP-2,3-diacylglucosamine hydrolase
MINYSTYFFISDVHLGLGLKEEEKEKEAKLVKLINYAAENCDELFILGDLLDYWFEYKHVIQKGYYKTLAALIEFAESGRKIHYFIGNHDFLHRNFFREEIGAILYEDPAAFTLNDKKFFIGHGDGLVPNDTGYRILKWILRNKVLQRIYSTIHPDLGIKIASGTSKTSRSYTSQKDYGRKDGLIETAMRKIDQGYDYVIFGHTHIRSEFEYNNGKYINLGSWLEQPCYGKFTDSFQIINW